MADDKIIIEVYIISDDIIYGEWLSAGAMK